MNRLALVLAICLLLSSIKSFGCGTPGSPMNCGESALYTEIHGTGIYTVAEEREARSKLDAIVERIDKGGLQQFAKETDTALNANIKIAVLNLKKKKRFALAKSLENGWAYHRVALTSYVMENGRPIGSFAPLSQWLADAYDKIEAALTLEICRALRLSDLKSLNYGLRVAFSPCSYGLSEFEFHFIHDDKYRGVAPVVAYHVASISCSIGTFGAGYFWICSPIALLVEFGMDRVGAPWLAPRLYSMACSE